MMKKVFFAFAVAGMFGFAACGSNNTPAEENTEAVVENVEAVAEEAVADSTVAVEAVAEEAATEAVAQ